MGKKIVFQCKCGCTDMRFENKGPHIGVYCEDCDKWVKWINQKTLEAHMTQEEEEPISTVPEVLFLDRETLYINGDLVTDVNDTLDESFEKIANYLGIDFKWV